MEKEKKKFYKKWWFWVIIVILLIAIATGNSSNNTNTPTSTDTYQKSNKVEVTIADFSTMTRDEVQVWFDTNKMNGKINDEYSTSIPKGSFISQSITANTIAHEGDKLTVTYSLGKEPTMEEKNALKKAESYSRTMHMSKQGIYDQLTSEYGEKFSAASAQYAIDHLDD